MTHLTSMTRGTRETLSRARAKAFILLLLLCLLFGMLYYFLLASYHAVMCDGRIGDLPSLISYSWFDPFLILSGILGWISACIATHLFETMLLALPFCIAASLFSAGNALMIYASVNDCRLQVFLGVICLAVTLSVAFIKIKWDYR